MISSNQPLWSGWAGRLAAVTLFAGLAFAQSALAQTADRTVETYGQWDLTCLRQTEAAAGKPARACEITQTTRMQGRSQPVMQLAIGRRAPGEDLLMVLQLPVGLWLPAGVTVMPGGAAEPQTLAFTRCLPGACLTEMKIDEALLTAMTETAKSAINAESRIEGAVIFAMQPDTPTRLPISYYGFPEALVALKKKLAEN